MGDYNNRRNDNLSFIAKYWQIFVACVFLVFSVGTMVAQVNMQNERIYQVECKVSDVGIIKNDVAWIKQTLQEKFRR